jgi:hypothetical protein
MDALDSHTGRANPRQKVLEFNDFWDTSSESSVSETSRSSHHCVGTCTVSTWNNEHVMEIDACWVRSIFVLTLQYRCTTSLQVPWVRIRREMLGTIPDEKGVGGNCHAWYWAQLTIGRFSHQLMMTHCSAGLIYWQFRLECFFVRMHQWNRSVIL